MKKQTDTVVKHVARPAFFMTWAYKDKPEKTAQLACTICASYKKLPVGNTYLAGIDPNIANFLQATAWETVQYYLVVRGSG